MGLFVCEAIVANVSTDSQPDCRRKGAEGVAFGVATGLDHGLGERAGDRRC